MKLFYNLMMRKLRFITTIVFILLLQQTGFAQLFQQNFTSSATVAPYVNLASPNTGQFNSILTTSGVTVSINSNALQFVRTTAGSATFTRSTDLAGPPQTMIYGFDFNATGAAATANSAAVFKLGEGFSPNNNPEVNGVTYGRIGVDFIGGGGWRLRNVVSGGTSATYNAMKRVTWVLNRTASTKYYNVPSPGTGYSSAASNTMDVYVDGVIVFNDIAVTTPAMQMTDMKFVINAGQNVTARITNMDIKVAVGQLTCPSPVNVTASADAGECSGYVTVASPVFSGPCSPDPMVDDMSLYIVNDYNGTENASDIYPVGVTTVNYTATDKCGNVYSCSQQITVNDNEFPVITPISVQPFYNTDPGTCTYTVTGDMFDAVATDNCYINEYEVTVSGATSYHDIDPAPLTLDGLSLEKGTSTILWEVTDGAGNTSTQTLTINVQDNEDPVISGCSSNIIQPRSCAGFVMFADPTATDNCSGTINVTKTRSDGATNVHAAFPVGTTTVTYTFTDASGNDAVCTFDVVINQLSASTIPTHILCNGAGTGAINLTVSNNVSSLGYAWSGPSGFTASTEDISGLAAGTYTYNVTDGPCSITGSVTLTQPTAISGATIVNNHVNCHGAATGQLTASASGGVSPYSYKLNGTGSSQPSGTFAGLVAGSYFVVVTDANGCTFTTNTVTITEPGVTVMISATNNGPVGHGGSLSVSSTPSGGVTPYTFSWTGPDGFTSSAEDPAAISPATAAATGTYTVVVTDANGCTATASTNAIVFDTQLYVNDLALTGPYTTAAGNDANPGTPAAPFRTIAHAISVAQPNDIIWVDAGTYEENIVINKALSIRGAKYLVLPSARTAAFIAGKADDAIESVLTTAVNAPAGITSDMVRTLANNITFDGFTVDGNNPALGSSSLTDDAALDIHGRRGFTNIDAGGGFNPVNNLVISNNIMQNIAQRGVSLANNGPVSTGCAIHHNLIRRWGWDAAGGQGIILFTNAYADIHDNDIIGSDNFGINLHLQNFFSNGAMTWNNNNIVVGLGGIGIHSNLLYAASATLTISNNSINAAASVVPGQETWGINIWTVQVGSTVTCTNNTVGSSGGTFDRGINLWNNPTSVPVTVTGGSVGNSVTGINMDNIDPYFGAGSTTVATISSVAVTGGTTGVRVCTAPLSPAPLSGSNVPSGSSTLNLSGVTVSGATTGVKIITASSGSNTASAGFTGCSVTGGTTGLQVDGSMASVSGNTLGGLAFSGQSTFVDLTNGAHAAITIDGTTATFNGSLGSSMSDATLFATEDKINHMIDIGSVGFVLVKASNAYITTNSFVSPNTAADINRGVLASSNGFTVNVGPGTFVNNVVVNKEVNIKGQGQASTTVIPALSGANPCTGASLCPGASNVFLVQAGNVTIQHLTVDGNNPSSTSGIITGGVDVEARNGIITNHQAGVYNNLNVHDVTVQNIYLRGMYASSGGTFTFSNNTISNVAGEAASIGMFNFGGSGSMTGNTISDCNDAMASNWSMGTTYSGNSITTSGSGIHSDNNGGFGGTSVADIITGNTVTNSVAGGYGIWVFAPYLNTVVSENTITNVEVSLACAGRFVNGAPLFSANTIDAQHRANSVGVYHTTSLFGFGSADVEASYLNNYITNTELAFELDHEAGYTSTITANNNSITGNAPGVAFGAGPLSAGTLVNNFECNYWGAVSAPAVASAVGAAVDYTPWTSNPTDNNAAPGFQPVGGSCVGEPVTLSSTQVNVLCFGLSTGSINLTVNTGAAPFTYAWTKVSSVFTASTEDLSSLSAGTYDVTVTDAFGSTATHQVIITQPAAALSVSESQTNVSCNGGSDGSATLTGAGGTAPYTYTFNSVSSTSAAAAVYNGLAAGSYPYSVTDANGCAPVSGTIVITEPDELIASAIAAPLTCNTGTTTATASQTGGTPSYTYAWSNGQTTATATGLVAGTYTVTVTDAHGCVDQASVTITNPVHTGNNWYVNNASAAGDVYTTALGNDANIGTASCPFRTITYAISQAAAGDHIFVDAGTYDENVTVNKYLLISGADSALTIVQPLAGGTGILYSGGSGLNVSNNALLEKLRVNGVQRGIDMSNQSFVTVSKVSVQNSSLHGLVVGGTSDLKVLGCDLSYNGTNGLRFGTGSGNNILVDGCRFTANVSQGIYKDHATTPTGPTPTSFTNVTITNNVFTGNGTVSNGKGIYTEALTNGVISNNTFVNNGVPAPAGGAGIDINLKYGAYTGISIQDNVFTGNGTTSPTGFGFTVKARNDVAGPANNRYNDFPATLSGLTITGNDISGSPIGVSLGNDIDWSTVTVTNNNFASNGIGFDAYAPDPGSVMSISNNSFTGSIVYHVKNQDPASSITANCNWFDNSCSAVFALKLNGVVNVTSWLADGNDGNGAAVGFYPTAACSSSNILIPGTVTHVACNGQSNGAIDITPSGGSGSYTYSWSSGQTTQDVSGLSAGTYTVTVSDGTCSASASFTITQPATLIATASVTSDYNGAHISCPSSTDGAVIVNHTGGNTSFSYLWSTGATTQAVSGLGAGTYTVTVTDNRGCTDITTVTIIAPPAISASIAPVSAICEGQTLNINLTAGGGTGSLSFAWTGPNYSGSSEDVSIPAVTEALNQGTYSVIVTDINSCTAVASVAVDIKVAPVITSCPSVAPVSNAAGLCSAVVTYPPATASGDPAPVITYSQNSGTSFPVGTTTVTVTATNLCSSATCTFDVVVNDTEIPSISCGGTVTVNNSPNQCSGTATLTPPAVSDNCSSNANITLVPVRSDAPLTISDPYPVGTTTVTWTATDESGNFNTCTQSVVVVDTQVPQLAGCFSQIIKEAHPDSCGAKVFYVPPTASDNCPLSTTITPSTAISGSVFSVGTTTVTYSFSDGAHTVQCTFNVIVQDTTHPVASCKPATIFLDGSGNATLTVADVDNGSSDACGISRSISNSSFTCSNIGTNSVTLTVTDPSGNVSTCSSIVTVVDNSPPVVTNPAGSLNASLECSDASGIAAALAALPAATDNCTANPVRTLHSDNTAAGSCANNYVRTRVYRFTDGSGNFSDFTQVITVSDNTAPQVTTTPGSLDHTLQCSNAAGIAAALAEAPAATDNCTASPNLVLISDNTVNDLSCANAYVRTRVWNFNDGCGNNSSSFTQVITVIDNTAPVVTTAANALDHTLQCSNASGIASALAETPAATDNCTASPNLVLVSDVTTPDGSCANAYVRTRVWNFNDGCGNTSASFTQVITVIDNTAPVVTTSAGSLDHSLECSNTAGIAAAVAEVPSATDNCTASPSINLVSDNTVADANCANAYVRTRVWNFSDGCGNTSASFTQVITVTDHTAPVVSTTAGSLDHTLQCSNAAGIASALAEAPDATDNCTASATRVLVSDVTTPDGSCANAYVRTRIWNFIDGCGNTSASFTQVITVIDNTAPVVTDAAGSLDHTFECSNTAGIAAALLEAPVATDNCTANPSRTLVSDNTVADINCANAYVRTRVWNFSDGCGNTSSSFTQVITVQDHTAPLVTTIAGSLDHTLQCSDASGIASAIAEAPSATDNCTASPSLVLVSDVTTPDGSCANAYVRTRVWNFNDGCGNNSASFTQVITVIDNTAPVITTLAGSLDHTLECSDATGITAALGQAPSATDNCTASPTKNLVSDNTVTDPSCANAYVRTRVWNYTDGCGNTSANFTQVITVEDNTAPVVLTMAGALDHTLQCSNAAGIASAIAEAPAAADACTATPEMHLLSDNTVAGSCANAYTRTRVWNFTDGCGNTSASFTQVITVIDNTAPVVSTVAGALDHTLQCSNTSGIAAAVAEAPSASDNCTTTPALVLVSDVTTPDGSCANAYVRTRVWNFTDGCGNTSANFTQVITVIDNTAPVVTTVSGALDASLECSNAAGIAAALALAPSATDNCATPAIHLVSDNTVIGSCPQAYTRTRTWNFTDGCGNTSSNFVQVITVSDNTAPVLSGVPANVNASCDNVPSAAAVTAADNCDTSVTPVLNESSTQTMSGCTHYNYTITRTWTATDDCNNQSSASQVITVKDTIAPSAVAQNITATLDEFGTVTISAGMVNNGSADNCSDVMLSLSTTTFTCANLGPNTVTLTVTDVCGNVSTATAVVTVTDETDPVVSCPATQTQYIGGSCTATLADYRSMATASDNCGTPSLTQSPAPGSAVSPGTVSVTITATDGSLNTGSCSFNVNVIQISLSTSVTHVSCNGGSNGAVSLTVNNQAPGPITYLWSNGATTQNISGIVAGTYTVTVTNGGCTFTTSATVTQPLVLAANATKTNVICNGAANGTATSNPSGGTAGYTYLWSNGQTTQSISGLAPGNYTVTVTDAHGCTATGTVTITQPAGMILATSKTNVTCPGGANGTANVAVSGGVTPYTYLWNTGATTPNITGLVAGLYTVTVTDNGGTGCVKTATVLISQPAAWSVSFTNVPGSLTVNASGATAPYTYKWNTGATTQTISTTTGSLYTVTVTDSRGCKFISSPITAARIADVMQNASLNVSAYPNPTSEILYLEFVANENDVVTITMHDLSGRLVFAEDHTGTEGLNKMEYMLNDYAEGMYLLTLNNGNEKAIIRVVVEK